VKTVERLIALHLPHPFPTNNHQCFVYIVKETEIWKLSEKSKLRVHENFDWEK